MKSSTVARIKNETLDRLLREGENRPGEYWITLDPIAHAKMKFFLEKSGYDRVEQFLAVYLDQIFDQMIEGEIAREEMETTMKEHCKHMQILSPDQMSKIFNKMMKIIEEDNDDKEE